jgi:co-chaperonin GroES (HSP10)
MKPKIKPSISPCGHYVLVKPDPVEETYGESQIVVATKAELKREQVASVRGTLIAVGPNAWLAYDTGKPWAKVNDRVFFKRHVADRIEEETDGEIQEYFLMSDDNILAVIGE